jgi:hypothetical protein
MEASPEGPENPATSVEVSAKGAKTSALAQVDAEISKARAERLAQKRADRLGGGPPIR